MSLSRSGLSESLRREVPRSLNERQEREGEIDTRIHGPDDTALFLAPIYLACGFLCHGYCWNAKNPSPTHIILYQNQHITGKNNCKHIPIFLFHRFSLRSRPKFKSKYSQLDPIWFRLDFHFRFPFMNCEL